MIDTKYLYYVGGGHNKFYDMVDNGDGTWTAHWGKCNTVGNETVYPIRQFWKKYYEKLDKGYEEDEHSHGCWE